ncbi:MAG: hypothetical protein DRG78_09710 [Epsilonproteobacteria bacterium]|nr:MAG: hypothetical protein DRG78_09710 [Campylobacterota bacterium]
MNQNHYFKNLIVGIDETTDIQSLLNQGIKQFYFGYLPCEFIEKYDSKLSLNRRNNIKEQFTNIDKIFSVIETIHKKDAIIYLTLNHITSNQTMLEYSKKIYLLFKNKVDGIIVSNITIATYLLNDGYKKMVTSNLFGSYSTQSIEFLINQFNPIKVILPRDMRLSDIEKIVKGFPDTNFECFLFGDGCRFSESFCFIDQGDYNLETPTLCSYASTNYQIVQKANPSFKMVAKDGVLDDEEKKQQLQIEKIDVDSLLDKLIVLSNNFDSKKIAYTLDILSRIDIEEFYKDNIIYAKAKIVFKILEQFPNASKLLVYLKEKEFIEENGYKQYHRTNELSIQKTIEFFLQSPNIVSYKIPARGRNITNMLNLLKPINIEYNYKQSMYKL